MFTRLGLLKRKSPVQIDNELNPIIAPILLNHKIALDEKDKEISKLKQLVEDERRNYQECIKTLTAVQGGKHNYEVGIHDILDQVENEAKENWSGSWIKCIARIREKLGE